MSTPSKIRNIMQSAQEREIVKTAPDMVVYIEGMPFIMNPYLKQGDKDTVPVNFNDFISSISTSYSIDSFIPNGTINLVIPNGFKHLFLAPGGNIIISLMSSLRIYAKSYFFSKEGNTVYRRIFNGLIKAIDLNETPTSLDITITICGICRLLEIVQTELNKSLMSPSTTAVSYFRSNQGGLSVYGAIYDTFERRLDFSEFITSSFLQDSIEGGNGKPDSRDAAALRREYIARWALRLQDLRKDIRLFGVKGVKEIKDPLTTPVPKAKKEDEAVRGLRPAPNYSESAEVARNKGVIDRLKNYHFDAAMGSIRLFGSQLTPVIERIRQLVESSGMEGYQDVDGLIIIKPPLYNLDCTVLGPEQADMKDENLYEDANPYIIHMAEVLSENYIEDESAIRRTSMTIAANFGDPNSVQMEGMIDKSQNVRYVDINLVRKYGVREEPPKYFGFLNSDKKAIYAFAVCELNKANRGFRTYHLSIPLRPEIRLGFPIYIPHRDMYAYVTGVAMSYNVGGQATTSLTCNYIRKRPLLPQMQTIEKTDSSGKKTAQTVLVFASQPNYIHAWIKGGTGTNSVSTTKGNPLDQKNHPSTGGVLKSEEMTADEKAVYYYRTKKMGELFETWVDNGPTKGSWRVQNDDKDLGVPPSSDPATAPLHNGHWYNGVIDKKTGVRTDPKNVDDHYLNRTVMAQPYTDEKGYEVIPLFPWGRYSTLRQAIVDTTRNYWYTSPEGAQEKIGEEFSKTSAFLMAGFALPSGRSAADIQKELDKNKKTLEEAEANSVSAADNAALASEGPFSAAFQQQAATASGAVGSAQGAVDSSQAALTQAGKQANSMSEVVANFSKFEKSNLISFELKYDDDNDFGKSETDFLNDAGTQQFTFEARQAAFGDTNDQLTPQEKDPNWADKLQTFLQGFLGPENSANVGPYEVSTLPQNTDIGGYRPPLGPFSGVLLSMAATFTSSPYGDIFGLRPQKKHTFGWDRETGGYFSSNNENRRNIG